MIAFRDAGWDVTGLGRANRKPVAGTRFVAGNADDVDVVRAATAHADVVVNGLHLRYDLWGDGRAEGQLQTVLDALVGSGKTVLYPGTIYNYRASDRIIPPTLRQSAETERGAIRIRLETMLADAARDDIQAIILRAGDFFGSGTTMGWFGEAILMNHAKGRLYHLGELGLHHAWAYLPDLARAMVRLAEARRTFANFETFHFAGHFVTHGEIMTAIARHVGQKGRIGPFPWWMLRLMGVVNPVLRDLCDMRYLWTHEMALVDPRLDALLGDGFATDLETAVAITVSDIIEARRAA
ncbi:hypothetical protein VE26_13420 [Devosia chinhatensis]|uniref:NAD-dependent epimerase/dehydratase domain-containing protein n=2 Tax=Devosia chinhatensis TaxID=429727 RepID=A0A0F5FFK3_9HYPH|nr:hypothetical protein VE26_13420 [Devosia chinhatensis]